MSKRALQKRRDHLALNRRFIIGRSLASAAAGSLPVPIVEEWLSATVLRGMIKRIADRRSVDFVGEAANIVADGPLKPPEWTEIISGTVALRFLSRSWRRLLLGVLAARRLKAASHTFLVATLFDHYCAKMHVGAAIDDELAVAIRGAIDDAITDTPGGLSRRAFRRGALAAGKATLRTPVELANVLSGGRFRKLLESGDDVHAVSEVDENLEKQLMEENSFLARASIAIENELATTNNPFLEDVLARFEDQWREGRKGEGE